MQFLDWEPPTLAEQRETVTEHLRQDERWPGYGCFAAASPAGEVLGWFALTVRDRPEVPDLAYRLHRRYWGQGLATEGALALIRYAFTSLGVQAVEADTTAVNQASRRVMAKCGLTYVRTSHEDFDDPLPGTEQGELLYRITRAQWVERAD
ncbi:MAG TPA: GNAT family N-acetyltransferase [Candidatus Ruania gallistercoris]|uniref:GNAT family N-acetyltransferase n=1 Tax=Candidatus Ruania gallistercoris TaxID=2838746 RepID=A0A9D2EDT1_9MICO|nr:GNAT family N-acetyltransferase [Candidatus Ruania gallistercoris]